MPYFHPRLLSAIVIILLADRVSAQQNNANLSSLSLSSGTLTPAFASGETNYSASVAYAVTNLTVSPDPDSGSASVAVQFNGGGFSSSPSGPLNVGTNLVEIRVTSGNFSVIKIYRVAVTRSGPPPPDVQTLAAVVAPGIVTLNGLANPLGLDANVWFEWAMGTDPTNAASFAPLTIAAVGADAKVRFSRNTHATDVTIHLQRTANLADANGWSGLVTNVAGVWTSPSIVTETGTNSVKSVEVSDALTNSPAADYRLKVAQP